MSRGARHVKLLNDLSPKQFNTLQHIARPECSTKVNIEAFSDDKMADRFSDALRTFNKTAAYQHGDTSIVVEGSRADIRLLLPRLFVDDPRHHPNAWTSTSFILKNPGASLSFPKQWNTAQRRVFESVLEGRGGVSGCIGPPGTGKTTTIGAIPGEMIKQFKFKAAENRYVCAIQPSHERDRTQDRCWTDQFRSQPTRDPRPCPPIKLANQ